MSKFVFCLIFILTISQIIAHEKIEKSEEINQLMKFLPEEITTPTEEFYDSYVLSFQWGSKL